MAKRITDTQRIINFGMGADEAALAQAIESLLAIRSNRFPKQTRATTARKPWKPRTPASTPPAASADEPSSSES